MTLEDGAPLADRAEHRPRRTGAAWHRVEAWAAAERPRWILWTPVGIGGGIGAYFSLPSEPPVWSGGAVLAVLAAVAFLFRRRPYLVVVLAAAATLAVGFAAAQVRTRLVSAPFLTRPIESATVTGRIEVVERLEAATRITIAVETITRLSHEKSPRRVRLRLAERFAPPPAGTRVQVRASLLPPPPPAEPGAYDFRQAAFFAGIGAVGFAYEAPEVIEGPPPDFASRFFAALDEERGAIAARVRAVADDAAAPVTIALLNGEQTGISEPVMRAMRASGLAHLLSISGLHITLAAGIVFFVVRALLALIEPLALAWPIKKIAALAGLLGAGGYTLIVGTPVPTLRSLLMTAILMLAVIADRHPFSPRVFAAAAVVVLIAYPETMLGPSFQMSFGAVAALIAAFEVAEPVFARWRRSLGIAGRAGLWLAALAFTSLVASAATAPFALYHFQNVTFYGVAANMVAVPLTSVWIMPMGLLAYLLMPLGLEGPALVAMNWGSAVVVAIARAVASWPGALALVPAMPEWGLTASSLGGAWLCLWRTRARLLGLIGVAAGLLSPLATNRPDILISEDGGTIAVLSPNGERQPSTSRGSRIAIETWVRRDGADAKGTTWPASGPGAGGRLSCDPLGCLYRSDGRAAALIRDPLAAPEDCTRTDVVVAPSIRLRRCPAPLVIDAARLAREGAHAIHLRSDGVRVETVRDRQGERPWTGPHP